MKAGLFSAVLTTFNVQSYLLLQPAAPDPSITVLQQISSQLASFAIHPPFINSTQPSDTTRVTANSPPPVPRWAVWLNALWFSGLILSLTSASVGIMVKQWLNEYSSGVSGTSRPISRVRLHRLNNLRKWYVEDVVNIIPILLQLALALFLAGLLILLWGLHVTVAAIASTLVGLLAIFTAGTTFLPLFDQSCSYLTPQVRTIHSLWQPKRLVFWLYDENSQWVTSLQRWLSVWRIAVMVTGETIVVAGHLAEMGKRLMEIRVRAPPESWRDRKQTWQGRERSAIDNHEVRVDLDKQTLVEAYSTTLSPDALSAASVCLMDLNSGAIVDYFRELRKCAREHFGATADTADGPLGQGNQQQLLWLQISLSTLLRDDLPLSDDDATALGLYFACGSWPSGMQEADAEWAVSACNAIFDHLAAARTASLVKFFDRGRIGWIKKYLIEDAMGRKKPLTNVLLAGEIFLSWCAVYWLDVDPLTRCYLGISSSAPQAAADQ